MKNIYLSLLAIFAITFASTAMAQDVDMQQFRNEPTIQETQQMSLIYSGLQSDRLESMYTRAGVANLLPKSVDYRFQFNDQEREYKYNEEYGTTADLAAANGTIRRKDYNQPTKDLRHEVKAQWDLSKLIYNNEQLSVVSQMNHISKKRTDLLKAVTKAYYARRAIQIELSSDANMNSSKRLKKQLKLEEYTAQLDAFTGGWFSDNAR